MATDLTLIIQLALGGTFAFALIGKLRAPLSFGQAVSEFGMLPPRASSILGIFMLLPMELFVAFSHLTGRLIQAATSVGLCLLLLFLVATVRVLRSGRQMSCNCFGEADGENISGRSVVRLVLMLAAELYLALEVSKGGEIGLISLARSSLHDIVTGWLPAWAGLMFVAGWIVRIPDLLSVYRWKKQRTQEPNETIGASAT